MGTDHRESFDRKAPKARRSGHLGFSVAGVGGLLALLAALASPGFAEQAPTAPAGSGAAAVTLDTFVRAESDLQFARTVQAGGFGKLVHARSQPRVAAKAQQLRTRIERDTLQSTGVFDLAAAPVKITLPNPGTRYMTLQALSQDHDSIEVVAAPGTFTYTQESVGTRYLYLLVRTLANPKKPSDVSAANALQDRIVVEQAARGKFEVPRWDLRTLSQLRGDLAQRAASLGDGEMFGPKGQVDPERHRIGTALDWGGMPQREMVRQEFLPQVRDGQTIHTLTVRDVPVDGFWSVTVYDGAGYLEPKELGLYNLTSVSTRPNRDGSYTLQFGGCRRIGEGNCLQITPGWTYFVRLYRPKPEALDGSWKFPLAKPILPAKP